MNCIRTLAGSLAVSAGSLLMGCMGVPESSEATREPSVGEATDESSVSQAPSDKRVGPAASDKPAGPAASDKPAGPAPRALIPVQVGCVGTDDEGDDRCHELAHQMANVHEYYRIQSPFCPAGKVGCIAQVP